MSTREPEAMYHVARELVARGLSVIPTGGGRTRAAKQPHYAALSATGHTAVNGAGETQATWRAFQERQATDEELQTWYLDVHARGIGLVTGAISRLVVVDVDLGGLPLLAQLGWKPHVISPSGGAHLYVRHPGWYVPSNASKTKASLPPGIDVRGDGGYIMVPPSCNPQGQYRRTNERRLLKVTDIPETVDWAGESYSLRRALGLAVPVPQPELASPVPSALHRSSDGPDDDRCPMWLILDRAAEYAPVSRNKGAFYLGLWGHANGYLLDETLAYVEEYLYLVSGVKTAPFPREEAAKAIRSGYSVPRKEPWRREEKRYVSN
ncbi:DNA primase/polymerase bifunctional N-terminal domain-containing protein [Deinococcus saxicola]|uniref:bifunctional DNA primase/polymerase n=1 Tax=Deinococcus saxicola TaxID=249406 RepID=UPI0039EE3FA9